MKALVIGGSGSSGVPVLHGSLERGHEVTVLHRGVHEPPGMPPESQVPHIHADPHFAETLTEAVGDAEYDLVLAMYGRVAVIADVFAKRCEHLISIGGVPAYRGCLQPDTVKPYGMPIIAREDSPLADSAEPIPKFAKPIRAAERAVFEHAANGDFKGSVVRYCQIYGPRNLVPWEWSVVKRVLDGRQQMILPDQGLGIISRCAARNAAEVVLKVVDNPEIADGQAYNVADDDQFSIRQWAQAVATIMGAELEFVGIPSEVAGSALMELYPPTGGAHILLDNNKAKRELGYQQVVPAAEALAEAVEWIQANPVTKQEYPMYPAKFDYEAEDRLIEAYAVAMERIRVEAPDLVPAYSHPMPHPKKAVLGRDESGR